MVAIRLKRMGCKARPYYRLVVTDSRNSRDGRNIEELGYYHPLEGEKGTVSLKEDRIKYWLSVGAKASETVNSILKREGVLATK